MSLTRFLLNLLIAGGGLLAVSWVCLVIGYTVIPPRDLIYIFWLTVSGQSLPAHLKEAAIILFDLRLPRIWLGIMVGGALSLSGGIFQGLLRNPLADPYLLGVSAGAICGFAIAVVMKLEPIFLPIMALFGGVGSIFLVYYLALEHNRGLSPHTLLLAGVIVNFFFSAMLLFLMTKAGHQLSEIVYLLTGSLAYVQTTNFPHLFGALSGVILLLSLGLCFFARELNALSLGDEMAQSIGVNVIRIKKFLFILTSILVGLVVSLSGLIGFVGLVVPHMVRLVIGPDHRQLLPLSFIAGAGFLIGCDTLARSLSAVEIPVGVITAFCGAPFFAWLLKKHSSGW